MTDDERLDEPDFDDPTHAGIRDLLASARVESPIPAEVAARLDATLAELTGRAVVDDEPTTVVPLRRRSKVGPRLLAAAAVIVVAGAGAVGLNQVVQNSGSDDKAGALSAPAARDSGGSVQPESAPSPPPQVPDALDSLTSGNLAAVAGRVPVLTTADFAHQATVLNLKSARLQSFSGEAAKDSVTGTGTDRTPGLSTPSPAASAPLGATPGDQGADAPADRDRLLRAAASRAPSCSGPEMDGVRSYPIVLDLAPAVLVVHPANAGTRLVEAWNCEGTQVLTFTTIPAK